MKLVTWNVLHRVHGLNHAEPAVARHADEAERTGRVVERALGWLRGGVEALCLQEASGDLVAALRAAGLEVAVRTSPRLPRLKGPGASGVTDVSESVAVATLSGRCTPGLGHTYENDPGKGFVSVHLGEVLVVSTHLTPGAAGQAQLSALLELVEKRGPAVVAGDFNAVARAVEPLLAAAGFSLTQVDGATRLTEEPGAPREAIDHLAVRGGRVDGAKVLEGSGLSDHLPLEATVVLERGG